MTKVNTPLDNIELSLNKGKLLLSKTTGRLNTLRTQRKFLKKEAKIVSLSEYKVIVKEIVETINLLKETSKKIDELSIQYENSKRNQKS